MVILLVYRFGRRPLTLGGLVVLTFTNLALGINFLFIPQVVQGYIAIALLALFLLTFNFGIGSLFWLLANEVWVDDQLKQTGPSLLFSVFWGLSIFTGISFLSLNSWIGSGFVFIVFGICSLVGTILLFILLPETKVKKQHHQTVAHTTFDS